MIRTTPAIVAQNAVRPLPRWALLLLCLAYVVPGFIGRDPWRGDDMGAFGFMRELALGHTAWSAPLLAGMPPDSDGLLPYWLGAMAMRLGEGWIPAELAARLPFVGALALTLAATWWAVYHLATSPLAQPVAFAFGGEAQPRDYARAIADGGLLALLASLGLAQFSHETTGYLTQLTGTALLFYATAAIAARPTRAFVAATFGLLCLTFSGAPTMALMLGLGSAATLWLADSDKPEQSPRRGAAVVLVLTLATALLAWWLDLWRWRVTTLQDSKDWGSLLRLLVWFSWPTWLLTLWALWNWRRQIVARPWPRHLWLPLWFMLVALAATLSTPPADRALLQGLPAFAALAAFALPTLRRGFTAVIDWFTLLFFSISGITIWVIWLAVQTGVPAKPAANVARLAPGFESHFEWLPFAVALLATLAWCALVRWRTARHRAAIWKSLVLPAGGATLGWVLLMTLWLPLLNYGRSYAPQVALVRQAMEAVQGTGAFGPRDCVATRGLDQPLVAALIYHGKLEVAAPARATQCRWAIVDADADVAASMPASEWQQVAIVTRPTDRRDHLVVLRRLPSN